MKLRVSRWTLTVAASAAVHAALLTLLLKLAPPAIWFSPAPSSVQVRLHWAYATSQAIDVKSFVEPVLSGAPVARAAPVPGAPAPQPLVSEPARLDAVSAAEPTVMNPVPNGAVLRSEPSYLALLPAAAQRAGPQKPIDSSPAVAHILPTTADVISMRVHAASIRTETVSPEAVDMKSIADLQIETTAEAVKLAKAPGDVSGPLGVKPIAAGTIAAVPANIDADIKTIAVAAPTSAVQPLETMAEAEQALEPQPPTALHLAREAIEAAGEPLLPGRPELVPEAAAVAIAPEPVEDFAISTLVKESPVTTPYVSPKSAEQVKYIDSIENRARRRYELGSLGESLALVQEGLQEDPWHAGLTALRAAIRQALIANTNERRVDALLDKAQRQLGALRLTLPAGDSAFETYGNVLRIDSDNQAAQAGINSIAERYGELARAKREGGDFAEGMRLVALGLSLNPKDRNLSTLSAELQDAVRAQAERERTLARLFARAQQQMGQRTPSRPAGEDASNTLAAILKMDPGNARAEQILGDLLARYETLARARWRDGDLKESLALIEEALDVKPSHAGLVALQKSLILDIEAKRRAEIKMRAPPAPAVETTRQPEPPSLEARERAPRIFGTF